MCKLLSAIFLGLFISCSSGYVELQGRLAPLTEESTVLAKELGTVLGADVLQDIREWHVQVSSKETFVLCGGSETALGCTSVAPGSKMAWIRIAMAPEWTLDQTSFQHELTHVWLAATTGDGDQAHEAETWERVNALKR